MSDEIELVDDDLPYPDTASVEEQRRAYVLSYLASPEIDIKVTLEACQLACEWLEQGSLPPKVAKLERVR